MEIFGVKVEAPQLPSLGEIRDTAARGLETAREFGEGAVERATDLGRQGVDLGRRAIRDPEGTVRSVAASARRGIDEGVRGAQSGVRSAVMWSGRQIHNGAEAARQSIPGNNIVSNTARNMITGAEQRTRFTVGVAGGLANEVVGLAGTVGSLGVTAAELHASPTARAELGERIAGGLESGARATADYARAAVADPGRVGHDLRQGATAAWNAGSGFVEGQVRRHEEAFARGEGPETLGMTTGQVASYVVPVGAGGRAAATAARGLEAAAVGGGRVIAREGGEALAAQGARALAQEGGEATLRAAGAETRVATLAASPASREAAEAAGTRLAQGADAGGTVRVPRHGGVTAQDLAAATRQTGREAVLFRDLGSGERFVTFGSRTGVTVPEGSRVIAHTQPGSGAAAVRASMADEAALSRLGQGSSLIIDEAGTVATRFRATEEGAALARAETGPVRLHSPEVGRSDLDGFRTRIGVPSTETIGVARTDIPALSRTVFEGASPAVRDAAGLARATPGPVASPSAFAAARAHAEEDIANQFVRAFDQAGLTQADVAGRTLRMHISNPTGVCNTCRQGLASDKPAGVIKQLSERYPDLDIRVTVETQPGARLVGPSDFTVRNGQYVARDR